MCVCLCKYMIMYLCVYTHKCEYGISIQYTMLDLYMNNIYEQYIYIYIYTNLRK